MVGEGLQFLNKNATSISRIPVAYMCGSDCNIDPYLICSASRDVSDCEKSVSLSVVCGVMSAG